MLTLLPGPKFLFLQFLSGYLMLLCNLLFWFGNNLLFGRTLSVWQGELVCGSSAHELCKFWAASWELCLPGCAQQPETLHLSP